MRFATVLLLLAIATGRLPAQGRAVPRTGGSFGPGTGEIRQEGTDGWALKYNLAPLSMEHFIPLKSVTDGEFAQPAVVVDASAANQIVAISGGVSSPQLLPWRPGLTLSSAIADCGGLSEFSSGKGIRIVRRGKVIGPYSFKDVARNPAKDPKLLPGDQVIVPE